MSCARMSLIPARASLAGFKLQPMLRAALPNRRLHRVVRLVGLRGSLRGRYKNDKAEAEAAKDEHRQRAIVELGLHGRAFSAHADDAGSRADGAC